MSKEHLKKTTICHVDVDYSSQEICDNPRLFWCSVVRWRDWFRRKKRINVKTLDLVVSRSSSECRPKIAKKPRLSLGVG